MHQGSVQPLPKPWSVLPEGLVRSAGVESLTPGADRVKVQGRSCLMASRDSGVVGAWRNPRRLP